MIKNIKHRKLIKEYKRVSEAFMRDNEALKQLSGVKGQDAGRLYNRLKITRPRMIQLAKQMAEKGLRVNG